jgi:co-chaperonin GroES (HSP10)
MLIPCGHRVVVKQEKLEDSDPTYRKAAKLGIMIADTDEKKREQAGFDKGIVISIGPGAFVEFNRNQNLDRPWCKVGDKVAFAKYSGKTVVDPDDHETYMVINDEDVVCIIRETK